MLRGLRMRDVQVRLSAQFKIAEDVNLKSIEAQIFSECI